MRRLFLAGLLALAAAGPARGQNFAPQPPTQPPRPGGPVATICSTEAGWCPIGVVAAPGAYCYCFVPPSTRLPGVARYFPYEGPVNPYLNPHTGPPATLR